MKKTKTFNTENLGGLEEMERFKSYWKIRGFKVKTIVGFCSVALKVLDIQKVKGGLS